MGPEQVEDGRSPADAGSGHEASPSAADASSQSRVPNAVLLERLRSKIRRFDLETGGASLMSDGTYKSWTNGEVWHARNPDGEEAAARIEELSDALKKIAAFREKAATFDGDSGKMRHGVVQWNRAGNYAAEIARAALASGIEARSEAPGTGAAEGESPVGEAETPNSSTRGGTA